MTERPFYVVPDGGRVTVLRRVPNSRAQTIATMLAETQAVALASMLNELHVATDTTLSSLKRYIARCGEVVKVLRALVAAVTENPALQTYDPDGLNVVAALKDARELLAVIDQQPVT